jgi:hypothetical protein
LVAARSNWLSAREKPAAWASKSSRTGIGEGDCGVASVVVMTPKSISQPAYTTAITRLAAVLR